MKFKKELPPLKTKLRVGDEVVVVSGTQKGKRGDILFIDKKRHRVVVQGVNRIKRFQRPSQENPKGGVLEIESGMHISNVMAYDSKSKRGVKIGAKKEGENKIRVSRKDGKEMKTKSKDDK